MTKQATLSFNTATSKWEAKYDGQVLCSAMSKGYVTDSIESGRCNKAKKIGIQGPGSLIEAPGALTVVAGATGAQIREVKPDRFNINERFDFLEDFVVGVAKRKYKAIILTGEGGLGKSFSVFKALKNPKGGNLICASDCFRVEKVLKDGVSEEDAEDDDYEEIEVPSIGTDSSMTEAESRKYYSVVKGFSTAKGLYEVLYHNRNRLVVFDDCDSVLKDPVALNLLKGALESTDEKRIISWRAKGFIDDGLPSSFEFKGTIIFISNKPLHSLDQAVRTRALCIDLSMNTDQKIERMTELVENGEFLPNFDMEVKRKALAFLTKMKDEATELSFRTLIAVTEIADTGDSKKVKWERKAEYILTAAQ